jgi:outer membrane protein assembly factor BamB
MSCVRTSCLAFAILFIVLGESRADDWPQWRGPRRDAVSLETGLLAEWPEAGPAVVWRASNVGTGYASVVISGGRVYTIGQHGDDVYAVALVESDGSPVWSRKIGESTRNSCSTPTVDGDRLYVLDPDGELLCLNLGTGDALWHRDLAEEFGGRLMSARGYGESPLVDGDRLICTPGGPEAAMVAFDKRTGEVAWKATLPDLGPAGKDGASFSSIVVTEIAGVRQYVQLMGRGLVGIEAETGRWLWGYNGISNDLVNIPTPVVRGDLVFSANGYNAGSVLLKIAREAGDDPQTATWRADVVYRLKGGEFQNQHGGVAVVGADVYGGHGNNNGLPTRLDLVTGKILWKQRGPGVGSAAVAFADDRLYFRYQDGLVALIEPLSDEFAVRGTLQIPGAGGDSWAHPAIANGRLYLREQDVLWVYDIRHDSTANQGDALAGQVELPADLEAVRAQGAAVERSSSKSPEFYRYASGEDLDHNEPAAWVVRFDNRHITEEGGLTPECFDLLKSVSEPVIVDLGGTRIGETALTQLASVPALVGLDFEFCNQIGDAACAQLSVMPHLRVLVLAGTGVGTEGLRALAASPSLVALDLEVCDAIVDGSCESLGTFPQLRALSLKKTGFEKDRVAGTGLQQLTRLDKLEQLNLYGNALDDAGLAHFASMSSLRSLNLSLLPITDAGLVHLQSLKKLRRLDLLFSVGFSGPKLTDAGAESLREMTGLESLNLTGTEITDAGLRQLQSLAGLKSIQITRTKITTEGVQAFRAALPGCDVDHSSQ